MGLIDGVFGTLFGGNRNVVRDTVEIFRENSEAGAVRAHDVKRAAMGQFAAEFAHPRRGVFDRFMDGLNRLPRPAMALGTLALFISAMAAPDWFASRMVGLALVPEPLWWLLGAVVSFYFGARHQLKGQEFQRSLMATMSRVPEVKAAQASLAPKTESQTTPVAPPPSPQPTPAPIKQETEKAPRVAQDPSGNAALDEWRRLQSA